MKNGKHIGAPATAGSGKQIRLAGVNHDLRNILQVLAGWMQMAREAGSPEERDHAIAQLAKAGTRARALLDRIAALAAEAGGPASAAPSPLGPLEEALLETAEAFRPLLPGDRDIRLTVELEPGLWAIPAEALPDVERCVTNLLLNGRDAIAGEGTLTVTAGNVLLEPGDLPHREPPAKPGRHVRISVADSGSGIPPELQSRIFAAYVTTKRHGTGLGLVNIKDLVEGHGGFVRFETGAGKGTRFALFLPVAATTS